MSDIHLKSIGHIRGKIDLSLLPITHFSYKKLRIGYMSKNFLDYVQTVLI